MRRINSIFSVFCIALLPNFGIAQASESLPDLLVKLACSVEPVDAAKPINPSNQHAFTCRSQQELSDFYSGLSEKNRLLLERGPFWLSPTQLHVELSGFTFELGQRINITGNFGQFAEQNFIFGFDVVNTVTDEVVSHVDLKKEMQRKLCQSHVDGCGYEDLAVLETENMAKGMYHLRFYADANREVVISEKIYFLINEKSNDQGRILVVVPWITHQFYNRAGGMSAYYRHVLWAKDNPNFRGKYFKRNSAGAKLHMFRASRNQIMGTLYGQTINSPQAIVPILKFMTELGIEYDLISDLNLHKDTPNRPHEAILLAGHYEYWTRKMIARFDEMLGANTRLLNISGNSLWGIIGLEGDIATYRRASMAANVGDFSGTGIDDNDDLSIAERVLGVSYRHCGLLPYFYNRTWKKANQAFGIDKEAYEKLNDLELIEKPADLFKNVDLANFRKLRTEKGLLMTHELDSLPMVGDMIDYPRLKSAGFTEVTPIGAITCQKSDKLRRGVVINRLGHERGYEVLNIATTAYHRSLARPEARQFLENSIRWLVR